MIASRRSSSALVADRRICSMCSLIEASFSMYVSRRRHVGLGLVVVVVGDEVLDRVLREELPELAVQLRGQRLVGRQHERRALDLLDHVGDREGLAGAGDAEQRLVREAVADALDQLGDRLRLVARRLVVGFQYKRLVFHSIILGSSLPSRWNHQNGTSSIQCT